MRPPKPRITKPRLHWKWKSGRWVPFHRKTWMDAGQRRERAVMLAWDNNPHELDRLYWLCEGGGHERQKNPAKYTWRILVEAWRADPRVQKALAASTMKSYRREMDALLENNADKDVRKTTRQGVRKVHDLLSERPRKADWRLQIMSLLWNYGKLTLDWPIGDNPVAGIEKFGPQKPFEPWPAWLVDKLAEAPSTVRTTAELILGTGQRPGAAIGMAWSDFRGEWMRLVDEKGGESFETFCPSALRAYLEVHPRTGRYILAKNLSEPMSYDTVEKAFREWRDGLGETAKPFTLHGLRKLAIVRLAEAGWSDAEIQSVTNQSAETVAYYRKRASSKLISKQARLRDERE